MLLDSFNLWYAFIVEMAFLAFIRAVSGRILAEGC